MKGFSLTIYILLLVVPFKAGEKTIREVIALVPMVQEETVMPTESWKRGEEMIYGAKVAVEMINNDSTILQDIFFNLITIDSNSHASFDTLVDFVRVATDGRDHDIAAIIGMFFFEETQIISPLAEKLDINLQLSTSASPKAFNNQKFPHLLHMLQSASVSARALFELIRFYNWSGLSVFTSLKSDSNYREIVEELNIISKQYLDIVIEHIIYSENYSEYTLDQLKYNIIVVSMNTQEAVNLICNAYSKNFTWPRYAWIILSTSVNDFKTAAMKNSTSYTADELIEGIIFIKQRLTINDQRRELSSGLTYDQFSQWLMQYTSRVNPYANILYDAVWTAALALNVSNCTNISAALNNVHHIGASGPLRFTNNRREGLNIEILQVRNKTIRTLGHYLNDYLTITDHIKEFHEINVTQIVYQSTSMILVAFLFCSAALCTIITTAVFFFYLYFRNEQVIKATSIELNLVIFLSCYLNLFNLFIANVHFIPQFQHLNSVFKQFVCIVHTWLNGLAVPNNLIISVVILKMIRVHRIFSTFNMKNKKCQSNSILYLKLLFIMLPNLIILILWSIIDTYSIKMRYKILPGQNLIITAQICDCNYLITWLMSLLLYLVLLMVILVVVAVKTRKIRYKNFKDTKKVNALVFLLILTIFLTLSYWLVLRTIESSDITLDLVLHVGYICELMGCLFMPKIYPLIKEKWFMMCSLPFKN